MKKIFLAIGGIAVIVVIGWVGNFLWKIYQAAAPAINPPPGDITEIINTTGMPLTLPAGFGIEIFARDLPGARVIAFDSFGNMWVSQTSEGVISLVEIQEGKAIHHGEVVKNARKPHGLAFDPAHEFALYYAEEDKISRLPTYSDGGPEKIADLAPGGRHTTRTLGFGPDGRLYVSIGSTCDVCRESNQEHGKIFSLNADGSDFKEFARGLRNAVFFAWHPATEELWATEMGRDNLGDDLPPDEVNIIRRPSTSSGQNSIPNFGWPICYGKNIHDTDFDKNTYIRNPCMEPFETQSYIDLPAHSAPLGLAFIPESDKWPEEYHGDLLVAYHGSWNRSEPTGYKIVRIELDPQGSFAGGEPPFHDFISGWLRRPDSVSGVGVPTGASGLTDGALGRPVDLKFGPDDALYISDDKAGVIYRVLPHAP